MIIPIYLRELRKQMTGRQWLKTVKAYIDAGSALSKIMDKYHSLLEAPRAEPSAYNQEGKK